MRTFGKTISLMMLTLTSISLWAQGPNNSGTYYQNADGKQGEALKTALCGIIYPHTERTYRDLWIDFRTTDVREDGKVWDMYSGITNYEFETDQAGNFSKEGDKYNREHSFPKSWFGSNSPMYTDLFHLYPTDGTVNGKRSNFPFGETKGESYKSAGEFSKLGTCTYPGYTGTVFEPNDEYKGDFARTYFYMVTCYEEKLSDWYSNCSDSRPTLDGNTYPGLSSWQLKMLMKWAKNDPVSEKEINRNNAVYGIQENRNPFIDYPGLEEYIWGNKTMVDFSYDNYDHTDGIHQMNNAAIRVMKGTFNLQGLRIKSPARGLYIIDGKKVFVR
ncbi:endonuclease [Prevotella sp. E13-17]|uniref:HNH endonuclease signature motif containing protein n=1 Tax=Prevotella sp. E13-17 TaxID=2913616 RepID=UPI001EDC58EF|nr:endonuclease [Prevotella sp. E13-17]UKK51129.1 endonuclease [Prevotella sp. E13-17]